jgi:hypothetical protein
MFEMVEKGLLGAPKLDFMKLRNESRYTTDYLGGDFHRDYLLT